MSLNLAGQRALNAARRFGRQSSALLRHVGDKHRRVLLLARTPAGCVSSRRSPGRCRPASKPREPQARPLAVASAHRPVSSPLAPPLPGSALHLSARPASAARALAWRLALRRSAPVVALLFNVSARPVGSHYRHRPQPSILGRALH